MHKRILGLAVALLAILATYQTGVGQKNSSDEVALFMRAKLEHCQKVLDGLTRENFEQIAKNAQELSLLSQAAQWQVIQTPQYLERSVEFRRAADALTEAARNKNLDGAALAYVDMTLKCIECHKYVRRTRMARVDLPEVLDRATVGE